MARKITTLLLALITTISLAYAQTPPENEIWYTTTDGRTISFDTNNLVSNSYNNDRGVLKFRNRVTFIRNNAFEYCSNLTSITIPNSVTSIGELAFSHCNSLKNISIHNSVTSIEKNAFWGCSSLKSITIPDSVTSIERCAFAGCSSLKSITIPNSVTSIDSHAFWGCSSLTSITIPDSVTSIESWAFEGCSSLTSITIPNSVTSIGEGAFYDCSSLTSITIPNSVTSIRNCAFRGCSSLKSITIPDSVTSIERYAFSHCSSLTSITIPNSVTSIGESVFYNCSSLKSIKVANKYCYDYFKNLGVPDITFIVSTLKEYEEAQKLGATNLAIDSNSKYASKDGLCLIDNGKLILFIGKDLTEYTIPNSTTSIGDYAFYGCDSLTSITCLATTPPAIGDLKIGETTMIYVPKKAVKAYKQDPKWSIYKKQIKPYKEAR